MPRRTPEQDQAMDLCAEALDVAVRMDLGPDNVILSLVSMAGVATFTVRQCADEMLRLEALDPIP